MSYEKLKPISLVFYAPVALSCSILRWYAFWSCLYLLVKTVLVMLLYHFWNIKLTAVIFSLFARKAFSKKELLIRKKSVLTQNTRERNITLMQRRLLIRMCISWQQNGFPLLCHIGFFSRKETEFSQSVLLLFSSFPLQDSTLIIFCQII